MTLSFIGNKVTYVIKGQGQNVGHYMHYIAHYTGKILNHCTTIDFVCIVFYRPVSRLWSNGSQIQCWSKETQL